MSRFMVMSLLGIASACGNLEATEGGGGGADAAAPRADSAPRADAAPVAPPCEGVSGPGGACYFLSAPTIEGATAWASATLDCAEQDGARLAVVTSAEENDFLVASYCPGGTCEPMWLGLNDRTTEGTFVWIDGSPLEFTAWGDGEPNDGGGEDCAELTTQPQGGEPAPVWNDIDCVTLPRRAICERN